MEFITKSTDESKSFGEKFSADLKGGEVVALVGDLGSGKTTFVQGLAHGLGIKRNVNSPTFMLMRSYDIDATLVKHLYHFDLYRLEGRVEEELKNIGFYDFINHKDAVSVIEWGDKATDLLPQNTIWINFEYLNEAERKITIKQ